MRNQHLFSIVVVSRPGIMRQALLTLLAGLHCATVVGFCGDGLNALELVAKYQPACVVIDANLLDEEVEALLAALKNRRPATVCLVLRYSDQRKQHLLGAGADVIVLHDCSLQQLEDALQPTLQLYTNEDMSE